MNPVLQSFEEIEASRFRSQQGCDHRQEAQRAVRRAVGRDALPILLDEPKQDFAGLVCGEVQIAGVHRRQFLKPAYECIFLSRVFDNRLQNRRKILAAVAENDLTGRGRQPHRVGTQVEKTHVG